MATLTANEITYIRMMTGDTCEDYDVSDEFMQYLHDEKATIAPLCTFSDPLGGTIVWVLRARVMKATRLFDETGDGSATSVSQKYTHLKEQLAEWESRCGMSGGGVSFGSIDMGIDSDDEGSEYLSRISHYYGASWWGGYW